jgi:hypothetical protein
MNKEFVPYEIALALKELGFDEPCFAIYNLGLSEFETANIGQIRLFSSIFRIDDKQSNISYINDENTSKVTAPLYQQAFRWFRENYDLTVSINRNRKFKPAKRYEVIIDESTYEKINVYGLDSYKTYEEAELACLKKLIQIVKEKKL